MDKDALKGSVSAGVTTGSEMTLEEVRSNCGSLVPGGLLTAYLNPVKFGKSFHIIFT